MNLETLKSVAGSNIAEVSGTVKRLFDTRSGTHQVHGPWTMQGGYFTLDSGEEIAITFKNMDNMDSLTGKHVVLKARDGKHGLKGVAVELYKDKLQLAVTGTADIETDGAAPVKSAAPVKPSDAPVTQPKPTGKRTINDLLVLYNKCYSSVYDTSLEQEQNDREHIRCIATSIFIQAVRDGIND